MRSWSITSHYKATRSPSCTTRISVASRWWAGASVFRFGYVNARHSTAALACIVQQDLSIHFAMHDKWPESLVSQTTGSPYVLWRERGFKNDWLATSDVIMIINSWSLRTVVSQRSDSSWGKVILKDSSAARDDGPWGTVVLEDANAVGDDGPWGTVVLEGWQSLRLH